MRDADNNGIGWVEYKGYSIFWFEEGKPGAFWDFDIEVDIVTRVAGSVMNAGENHKTLVLKNAEGEVIAMTLLENDGNFVFNDLPVVGKDVYFIYLADEDGVVDEDVPPMELELYPGYGFSVT